MVFAVFVTKNSKKIKQLYEYLKQEKRSQILSFFFSSNSSNTHLKLTMQVAPVIWVYTVQYNLSHTHAMKYIQDKFK